MPNTEAVTATGMTPDQLNTLVANAGRLEQTQTVDLAEQLRATFGDELPEGTAAGNGATFYEFRGRDTTRVGEHWITAPAYQTSYRVFKERGYWVDDDTVTANWRATSPRETVGAFDSEYSADMVARLINEYSIGQWRAWSVVEHSYAPRETYPAEGLNSEAERMLQDVRALEERMAQQAMRVQEEMVAAMEAQNANTQVVAPDPMNWRWVEAFFGQRPEVLPVTDVEYAEAPETGETV